MAKVKVSKKSTRIDMTAMCDVAFLLLSFFIMTATAKQPEPKPVDTPASTVIDKLPDEGVATITIGDKQVFFTIPGPELRRETLKNISAKYNIPFTEEEYEEFEGLSGFGVPVNQLKGLLKLEPAERIKEGLQKGIPYDSINDQLSTWIDETRKANRTILNDKLATGEIKQEDYKDLDIAIKGDAKEEYPTVKRVIDILQKQKKNRFFLVTGLRDENF
ncbi:MAG: ExbD/TolR family protein [Flavobacterium sp.]